MTAVISFGVSVTVDYAIVLDSKGIREAVQENNPIKALNSFAFRDTFDGVGRSCLLVCFFMTFLLQYSLHFLRE